MVLTGDTEPAQYMFYKPYAIKERTRNFDWEQVRWLRFERHFQSAGRFAKNLAIGFALLILSLAVFTYHRSRPDDVSRDVIDWSAIPDGGDDAAADVGDIDIDV
jgi:hypothetical protein